METVSTSAPLFSTGIAEYVNTYGRLQCALMVQSLKLAPKQCAAGVRSSGWRGKSVGEIQVSGAEDSTNRCTQKRGIDKRASEVQDWASKKVSQWASLNGLCSRGFVSLEDNRTGLAVGRGRCWVASAPQPEPCGCNIVGL